MKSQRDEIRARMEAMTRARALEQEIVRVTEREQMRIGQDLHDGLCQNLAAIDCAAACLKSDLESRAVPEAAAAGNIQKLLQEAIVEARNLARGISPVHMDAENLPAALEDLVASANRATQAAITFAVRGQITIGDTQTAIHLYRIAQEALRNAVRHSGAGQVAVGVERRGAALHAFRHGRWPRFQRRPAFLHQHGPGNDPLPGAPARGHLRNSQQNRGHRHRRPLLPSSSSCLQN